MVTDTGKVVTSTYRMCVVSLWPLSWQSTDDSDCYDGGRFGFGIVTKVSGCIRSGDFVSVYNYCRVFLYNTDVMKRMDLGLGFGLWYIV